MPDSVRRLLTALAAAVALAGPVHAEPVSPLAGQSFQIGTGGAQCEAQGVRLGDARNSVFDRKWALICSDVARPVGAAYSWMAPSDVEQRLSGSREVALECSGPGGAPDAGPGVIMRRCRDAKTGLEWNSYTASAPGRTDVVEGVAVFDGALRLALANLMLDRIVPGQVAIATTGGTGSLAEARASLGDSGLLIGQSYRRNSAGEYVEAEEYFQPDLLIQKAKQGPQAAAGLAAERHEVLVNRALQLSNKLVQLDDQMFALYISPERSTGWRVAANAAEAADLVSKLRDSISLTIGGVTATYPFDVDSSRKLYSVLFGPVAADLAKLRHLVFEPDGALLQLPARSARIAIRRM